MHSFEKYQELVLEESQQTTSVAKIVRNASIIRAHNFRPVLQAGSRRHSAQEVGTV